MPPSYGPADRARFAEPLFHRLAAGESLESIAATPGWPSRPTLRKWARQDFDFAARVAGGRSVHATRPRFPCEPEAAQRLLLRIRLGDALNVLIRQPDMPHRRQLNAWKRQDPGFAAELEAAKAFADHERRRYGRGHHGYRRSRLRYDEATADRIMLAVMRGATLPELGRDPSLPTALGLKRWRRANPDFDAALRSAMKMGHRARGRARVDRHCTPELTAQIEQRIVHGASLHSLASEPDMPSLYALYKWVRDRPDFAAAVAAACEFRQFVLADQAYDLVERRGLAAEAEINAIWKRLGQMNPYPGEKRRGR